MRYTDDVFERLHEDNADVIINIRLEHLYTNFLLYKLLVQQRNTHHSQFLEASHEIVRIVISVMKRPNVKPVLIVDVEWMVSQIMIFRPTHYSAMSHSLMCI